MKTTKIPRRTIADRSLTRAYVITKGRRAVAQIHILFPRDGAGTLRAECWHADSTNYPFQSAKAGGYGYDKVVSALSCFTVDGHKLSDHCGMSKPTPKSGVWPRDAKAPRGWRFSNFQAAKDGKPEGYTSLYREAGLDYLRAIGYTVTQVF